MRNAGVFCIFWTLDFEISGIRAERRFFVSEISPQEMHVAADDSFVFDVFENLGAITELKKGPGAGV